MLCCCLHAAHSLFHPAATLLPLFHRCMQRAWSLVRTATCASSCGSWMVGAPPLSAAAWCQLGWEVAAAARAAALHTR